MIMGKTMAETKPEAIEVTAYEGGKWRPFLPGQINTPANTIHAVRFADGSVWDCYNGWRTAEPRLEGDDAGT